MDHSGMNYLHGLLYLMYKVGLISSGVMNYIVLEGDELVARVEVCVTGVDKHHGIEMFHRLLYILRKFGMTDIDEIEWMMYGGEAWRVVKNVGLISDD